MLIYFLFIYSELLEKGYLYSVGQKKFLSLDDKTIRTVPQHIMPSMFEIETRPDGSSYTLRIYPVPRQNNNVVDKDWWWNDHRLIIHPTNNWQSEHFIFALVPQNMLKIIVKGNCAEVQGDGSVQAKTCRSKKNSLNQYYRWFNETDKDIVEEFVESKNWNRPYYRDRQSNLSNDDFMPRRYLDRNRPKRSNDDDRRRDDDLANDDFVRRRPYPGRPPYDDGRPPYDDGRPPYDDRRSSYDDRRPPYDDRRSSYKNPYSYEDTASDICDSVLCTSQNKRRLQTYDKYYDQKDMHRRGNPKGFSTDVCGDQDDTIEDIICRMNQEGGY